MIFLHMQGECQFANHFGSTFSREKVLISETLNLLVKYSITKNQEISLHLFLNNIVRFFFQGFFYSLLTLKEEKHKKSHKKTPKNKRSAFKKINTIPRLYKHRFTCFKEHPTAFMQKYHTYIVSSLKIYLYNIWYHLMSCYFTEKLYVIVPLFINIRPSSRDLKITNCLTLV